MLVLLFETLKTAIGKGLLCWQKLLAQSLSPLKCASKLLKIWPVPLLVWLCLSAIVQYSATSFGNLDLGAGHALRFYTPITVSCMMLVAVNMTLVVFGFQKVCAATVVMHPSARTGQVPVSC